MHFFFFFLYSFSFPHLVQLSCINISYKYGESKLHQKFTSQTFRFQYIFAIAETTNILCSNFIFIESVQNISVLWNHRSNNWKLFNEIETSFISKIFQTQVSTMLFNYTPYTIYINNWLSISIKRSKTRQHNTRTILLTCDCVAAVEVWHAVGLIRIQSGHSAGGGQILDCGNNDLLINEL